MMTRRHLPLTLCVVSALTLSSAGSLWAAANLQIFTLEHNNPNTIVDDILVQTDIHWADQDVPVQFLAFRPAGGEILPFVANINQIADFQVNQALNRAAEAWVSDLHDFEYQSFVLPSDFLGIANQVNPAGFVQLDGFSFVTFFDQAFVGDALGVSNAFTVLRDFELFDLLPPNFEIPIELIGDNVGGVGQNVIGIDLDADGFVDVFFPRTEFRRGEILDSDIALTLLTPFKNLPEDPDDIPDELFQDEVFFNPDNPEVDLQQVAHHELGHSLGLAHTYLFDPVMFPALTEDMNPYDKREPLLDDNIGGALTYFDGLSGMGAIAGSLISGAEADGVAPDGTPDPADPALLFLFQNPVFVGVPDPGFDLTQPQSGIVPTHVPSDQGAVRLLSWAYAGRDAVFPASEFAVGPSNLNGEFFIPGLEPRDDYILYTTPQPGAFNAVAQTSTVFEAYGAEFYGGAIPFPFGTGSGIDRNDLNDNTVESRLLQAGFDEDGQFTLGFDSGPDLLFGHPVPGTSFSTLRVIDGGTTTDFINRFRSFGAVVQQVTLNDGANLGSGTWEVPPGVQIRQVAQIIAGDGDDNNDDLLISYEVTNQSEDVVSAGVRVMLDTITGDSERNPFIINGQEFTSSRTFEGAAVPATWSMENPAFPRVVLSGRLIGPLVTTPSRFVIGRFSDLFDSEWEIDGGGSFTSPDNLASDGAAAIFFDPVPLASGGTVTFSTLLSGVVDEIVGPDTGVQAGQASPESLFVDDPGEFELITVNAGEVTDGLNIFTNTGIEPPGTDGAGGGPGGAGPVGGPAPLPEPIFGDPEEDNQPVEFPDDVDASIDVDVADVDNDGDLDIVYANTAATGGGEPSAAINRLYLNGGFANEMEPGNFVDGTFGRNGVPDGPAPAGDDRMPIVYDSNPDPLITTFELINEVSSSVDFADFDGDGFVDLFVGNSISFDSTSGGQNRIFMNREGQFGGESFRHLVDQTIGLGGPPRMPGILNQGPFPGSSALHPDPDVTFRCDVADIDNDGDIDILVCNTTPFPSRFPFSFPVSPELAGTQQIGRIPTGTADENDNTGHLMFFGNRVLINDGDGFFRDDTLGEDNLFGGRPRGLGVIPGLLLSESADRDRLPPLMWDYLPDNDTQEREVFARHTEVVFCQFEFDSPIDFVQVSAHLAIPPFIDVMEGQLQVFGNDGEGYFANITWGLEFILDPDISDAYEGWEESTFDGTRWTPPLLFAPARIGIPDGAPFDDVHLVPFNLADVDFVPFLVEDDTFGAAAADLDNDGDTDFLVGNMGNPARILTNFGFAGLNHNELAIGVVDEALVGSGVLTFIVGENNEVLPGFVNDGDARLGTLHLTDPPGRIREMDVGDVDLDGDPDVYYAMDGVGFENVFSDPVQDGLFLNNGQGDLLEDATANLLPSPLPSNDVELADMDNDGDLDAVLSGFSTENAYLENFAIDGPVTPLVAGDMPMFTDASTDYLPQVKTGDRFPDDDPDQYSGATTSAVFVDLDSDGDLDLYHGEGLQGLATTNRIYINTGVPLNDTVHVFKQASNAFPAPRLIQGDNLIAGEGICDADFDSVLDTPNSTTPTGDVVTADFDGDQDFDIFVVNNGFRNSMLWNVDSEELAPGSFLDVIENETTALPLGSPGFVRISSYSTSAPDDDALGDGLLVDVTGFTLPGITVNPLPPTVPARPGNLDQQLELSRGAAAGDLDGDGDIDLFVANGVQNGAVKNVLLINRGNGVFDAVNDPSNNGRFTPESTNVQNSSDARIFDLDNDGDLDIWVADDSNAATVNHTLWINDGSANFTAQQVQVSALNGSLDQRTNELLVVDFDGDGEPTEDLDGDGYLDPEEDLDGDGVIDYLDENGNGRHDPDYDVFLCNSNARDVIFVNDGAGNFTDESDDLLPDEDLNDDGILDPGEDSDSNGVIGPIVRDTQDADFADVDLDGDLDLALAQFNFRGQSTVEAISVQLLINDEGVFRDVSNREIGTTEFNSTNSQGATAPDNGNSRAVEFADVDGDGDQDLFVANIGQIGGGRFTSAPNVMLINRTIGMNLNARALSGIAPGIDGPVVNVVQPPSAVAKPTGLWVTLRGFNFQNGATADFGQGITTLSVEFLMPNELRARIEIGDDALPGARRVTVTNPDGQVGATAAGAFTLTAETGIQAPPTAVSRTSWTMYR